MHKAFLLVDKESTNTDYKLYKSINVSVISVKFLEEFRSYSKI